MKTPRIAHAVLICMLFTLGTTGPLARAETPAAAPAQRGDASWMALFDQFNRHDIEMAKLAKTKTKNPHITELADMIITDHGKIRAQARALAKRAKLENAVADPGNREATHAKTMALLRGTPPAEFDRVYLSEETRFSREFVDSVKSQILPGLKNGELKRFIQGIIPDLDMHLEHMGHTAHALGGA